MKLANDSEYVSQADLYAAICMGDEMAFGRYYESTIDWLVVLIQRITKDTEEARNIAHDTFVKLWLGRENIDPAQSLDGFVSKVATNAALNFRKKTQTHARYHSEQLHTKDGEVESSDERLIARQTLTRIEQVISQMPPKRKEAFLLHHDDNMTSNEIAERMGLSVKTVRMHLQLAEKTLKESLLILFLMLFLRITSW